jgi:catechol 2,3-dioxygenase-like lactoylglutathione lyase family enzyme
MAKSTNSVIPGLGTHHIAIHTYDLEASLRLYRDVLGMKFVTEFGRPERRILVFDIGDGTHVELFGMSELPAEPLPTSQHPLVHFALRVDDTEQAIEHVRAAGYKITVEPKIATIGPNMDVKIGFFDGPSGESIEFFQVLY